MMLRLIFLVTTLQLALSTNLPVRSCECGLSSHGRRVINGNNAPSGKYPWVVYLEMKSKDGGTSICTGSIINDRYILTAAHCLQEIEGVNIYSGKVCKKDFRSDDKLTAASYVLHHRYRTIRSYHDIALIELLHPIDFARSHLQPICLPTFDNVNNLFFAGFGLVNNDNEPLKYSKNIVFNIPKCMQHADLDIRDKPSCERLFGKNFDYTRGICAGGESGICQGDSGGPLMTKLDGRTYQMGIASFSKVGCGVVSHDPGVFERVRYHLDWIATHTKNAKWCHSPQKDLPWNRTQWLPENLDHLRSQRISLNSSGFLGFLRGLINK